jgi:hypothetical protein
METYKELRNPRKKPVPIPLGKSERKKAEAIADSLEVSLAEAIRRAIIAYPLDQN